MPPFPRVSTRDHFNVTWFHGEEAINNTGPTDYDFRDGPIPGWNGQAPNELLIHVHGFMNSDSSAVRLFETMRQSLQQNNYLNNNRRMIGFTWDSNWNPNRWWSAVSIAKRNGTKLAEFIEDYRGRNPNTDIRITAHSLGAQVTVSTLQSLQDDHNSPGVRSVSLLGGAVRATDVVANGQYGNAIANETLELHNFYSSNDGVLRNAFGAAEGQSAVGLVGAGNNGPQNYHDHDVSATVGSHFDYIQPNQGCIGDVVNNFP